MNPHQFFWIQNAGFGPELVLRKDIFLAIKMHCMPRAIFWKSNVSIYCIFPPSFIFFVNAFMSLPFAMFIFPTNHLYHPMLVLLEFDSNLLPNGWIKDPDLLSVWFAVRKRGITQHVYKLKMQKCEREKPVTDVLKEALGRTHLNFCGLEWRKIVEFLIMLYRIQTALTGLITATCPLTW